MTSHRALLAALASGLLAIGPAVRATVAQIDYRNLDDDRPVRVEDAYAAERYAFEFLFPYGVERERGGGTVHASLLELAYGLLRNGHVGIKAPFAVRRLGGTSRTGLAGIRIFGLYNFNTESRLLPAFSLRTDWTLPAGALGGSAAGVAMKAIVTRSWGRNRVHLNAAFRFGRDGTPATVEAADRWWYGVAVDRTLFRPSLLLIGAVDSRRTVAGAPVETTASLGLRWQWQATRVLDLGVSRRLRAALGPDYAITVGLSNAFALTGLMPGGR